MTRGGPAAEPHLEERLHQGEVASIGMTARVGPTGAEAAAITVPALRGRWLRGGRGGRVGVTPIAEWTCPILKYRSDKRLLSAGGRTARLALHRSESPAHLEARRTPLVIPSRDPDLVRLPKATGGARGAKLTIIQTCPLRSGLNLDDRLGRLCLIAATSSEEGVTDASSPAHDSP